MPGDEKSFYEPNGWINRSLGSLIGQLRFSPTLVPSCETLVVEELLRFVPPLKSSASFFSWW